VPTRRRFLARASRPRLVMELVGWCFLAADKVQPRGSDPQPCCPISNVLSFIGQLLRLDSSATELLGPVHSNNPIFLRTHWAPLGSWHACGQLARPVSKAAAPYISKRLVRHEAQYQPRAIHLHMHFRVMLLLAGGALHASACIGPSRCEAAAYDNDGGLGAGVHKSGHSPDTGSAVWSS
jgi:hypothetical protein